MSITPQPVMIRDGDYYGGDLSVRVRDGDAWEHDVAISWDAWGGHGRVELIVTLDEARRIANALLAELAKVAPATDTTPSTYAEPA